jgi:hypothetical protein
MRNVLLKTQQSLETTSRVLSSLYAFIGFLVLWDVLTTYINMFVLADKFGEYGIIASITMQTFGWGWGLVMLPIEFGIFAFITYIFAKNNHLLKIVRIRIPLKYLPAIALGALIVNNIANLVLFMILSSYVGTLML